MGKIKTLVVLLLLLAQNLNSLPLEDENSRENNENLEQELLAEELFRLSENVVPIHYDIKLIPYIQENNENNFTFDGETITQIYLKSMTQMMDFHSLELTFNETATYLESENGQIYNAVDFTYLNESQIMTILFDNVLSEGIYKFYTKFTGIINDELQGFYRSSYINDNDEKIWLATTQFQPTYARQAFPCWDEPSLKATFNVSIKHRTNYTALSNMPVYEKSMIDENDGKIWTHFHKTPIMSTYTLAFVVSDFVNITNDDGTITIWARSNILPLVTFGYEVALKASVILEEYTNSSMLIPKMDHVVIPDYRHGAMENWGLITYDENTFVHNSNKSTMIETTVTAMVVVHELAHQWFGNVVSPIWWNHIWLNEGFASFFQYYITDKIFPSWRFMELLPFNLQLVIHENGNNTCDKPISRKVHRPQDIEGIFDAVLYTKTQYLLNMLRHVITDEVFHTSLINYLRKNQYGNPLPDNLFNEIQTGVNNTSEIPRGEFNVKEVMETWIYQGNYPLVTVKRNYVTGEATITQEIAKKNCTRTNSTLSINKCELNECNDKWWIPINYATKTDTNFLATLPVYWLSPNKESIVINGIDVDDWIIINVQQTGYYQVNYDDNNWIKLAKYLNSPNYNKIHVLNRAQIIQDSYSMITTNRMNFTTFLELFNYLSQETDYVVWRSVFMIFDDKLFNLIETTEGHKLIQPYINNLMNNFIESLGGFDFNRNDDYKTQLAKSRSRTFACLLDNQKCIMTANTKMKEFLEFSNEDQYPSDLTSWAYNYGINNLNESTWNKLWDLKNNNISDITIFLSRIRNYTIIEKYLNMTIDENSPFTEKDSEKIYEGLSHNRYETNNFVIDFILRNWETINSRKSLRLLLSKIMMSTAADKNKLQEIKLHLKDLNEDKNVKKFMKRREQFLTRYEPLFDIFKAWLKTKELK